jgi:hypothetical protein
MKKITCRAREALSVRADGNHKWIGHIKKFENFVGAYCKFLKIGGKIEKVFTLWGD